MVAKKGQGCFISTLRYAVIGASAALSIRIFLTDHSWNLGCCKFGGALFGLCLDFLRQ
jgi:hypothetical protein